ncbi:hypothetical protein H0I23_14675 [Cellulophaga sp. HaHaR_3_176]|uniref:DUF6168 family protein n=1 Tax=Cellulophaga sp. HaHaR_3_176 TaxID=1942464 RepID=UPI001C1F8D8B|nr:DUF6168 family protein [Cellulophaga sp. HaHaR_3_176]QWX83680.1 hypothetical protein H0I23_14675 [Cellulophaga sp. HaHaR_3_176]
MLKSIINYIVVFSILFIFSKYTHLYLVEDEISFPLGKVYLYHYLFSLGICILFAYLASAEILKQQLGFVYLGTLFLKIIFFVIIFEELVFGATPLPRIERFYMLVPLALFLTVEVLFISKILKRL